MTVKTRLDDLVADFVACASSPEGCDLEGWTVRFPPEDPPESEDVAQEPATPPPLDPSIWRPGAPPPALRPPVPPKPAEPVAAPSEPAPDPDDPSRRVVAVEARAIPLKFAAPGEHEAEAAREPADASPPATLPELEPEPEPEAAPSEPSDSDRRLSDERVLEVLDQAGEAGAALDLLSRWFNLSFRQMISELEGLVESGTVVHGEDGNFRLAAKPAAATGADPEVG